MTKDRSSYKLNNFDKIFKNICIKYTPSSVLEIGLLDGYSLNSFVKNTDKLTSIVGIDLFENYEYKNSNYSFITNKFKDCNNVKILKDSFYEYYKKAIKFDIIHIDISNDGDIYKFALQNYFPLVNKALIMEGGSRERDNVEWMIKFDKKPINPYLMSIQKKYKIEIIEKFPSLTIIS